MYLSTHWKCPVCSHYTEIEGFFNHFDDTESNCKHCKAKVILKGYVDLVIDQVEVIEN